MKKAYLASLFAGIVVSLVYLFQMNYSSLMTPVSNALFLLIPTVTLISAIAAIRKYWKNLSDKYSQIWLLITMGLLIWFVSRVSLSTYTLTLNIEMPFPSVFDAIWLAGYVPIFAAMHSYLRSFGFSFSKLRYSAFAAGISLILLVCFVLLVPPVVAASEEGWSTLLSIVYLGLDLSLLSMSIHGLFVFFNGRIGVAWAFISSALFLNAVGGMLFGYAIQNGTYHSGHILELLFLMSSMLGTLAFYTHMREL